MRALFLAATLLACAALPAAAQPSKPATAEQAKPAATKKTPAKASKATATAASPVNINTASQAQLETLPGVGAKAAQRIIEFRQKNGGFKKPEDLMNVQGVGEKSFLKLKPLITVGERADHAQGAK